MSTSNNIIEDKKLESFSPQERLILKKNGAYHVVRAVDILFVESSGNYVNVISRNNKFIYRSTLKSFLKRLDPHTFYRIHRCTVVNIDYIKKINTSAYGDYEVELVDNTILKMTRNYREMFDLY